MAPEVRAEVSNTDASTITVLRAQTGVQPKASKLPPLIPTFAARVSLTGFVKDLPKFEMRQKLPRDLLVPSPLAPTTLPKGSKLLGVAPAFLPSTCCRGGVIVSGPRSDDGILTKLKKDLENKYGSLPPSSSLEKIETQIWGVPWSEEQFVEQMVQFGHPCMMDSHLPGILRDAVDRYFSMSESERISYRTKRIGSWLKRLKELRCEENELKQEMDGDVRAVLSDKNLLLWKHMLLACDYLDMDVFQEFTQGTELIGDIPRTGLWPAKFQPATITVEELHDVAIREMSNIFGGGAFNFDDELVNETWSQTLDEVDAGYLIGPMDISFLPQHYTLSRRFSVHQGSKIRCIDDFSMSSVNACVQASESPKPHTVDTLAALCTYVMHHAQSYKKIKRLGRPFDLKGAYRQCAIRPTSFPYSRIFLRRPSDRKLVAFRMRALPFGAIRSVHGFLRIAVSLWHIMVREFLILTTNYFDDYVVLGSTGESNFLTSCIHLFFKLLGWRFAESGPKAPDFSACFQALGITLNVTALHENTVLLDNTESRKTELIAMIDSSLRDRKMSRQDALRLRGRLQFSSGQVFGSVVKSALAAITHHAYGVSGDSLSDETMMSLSLRQFFLSSGGPRELHAMSSAPFFIQTDASFEWRGDRMSAGIGAVLFDFKGRALNFFSVELDHDFLRLLNPSLKKTIIFECEFFALFCAFKIWSEQLGRTAVIYTVYRQQCSSRCYDFLPYIERDWKEDLGSYFDA